MKRAIVDYKKITPELLKLLVETYPEGYADSDIIRFKNAKGEQIEAVEVNTEDTKYLVKISAKLEQTMAYFDEDEEEQSNSNEDFELEEAEGIEEEIDD